MHTNPDNEKQLLIQIASGDRQAFTQLYELHAPWLSRYIALFTSSKEDTEEVLQEVFIRLWQKKEQLPEIISFGAWLNRMTRNMVLNYIRSIRLKQVTGEPAQELGGNESTDARLLFSQYYNIAMEAIERLPTRRKEVFRLRLEENLSLNEIAERLQISRSAVEQHVYAANAFVREYLQKHAGIGVLLLLFISLFDF